jgi:hypothetical protein
MPKEFREPFIWRCLHRGMYKELDAMVYPHAPLPFTNLLCQHWCEVDPIRVDPFVDRKIWLDPIAIDIARVGLLRTKAAINVNLFDPCRPKCFDSGSESLQKPPTPGRKSKTLRYFLQSRLMITWRQSTSIWIELRNQAASIISGITAIVNI